MPIKSYLSKHALVTAVTRPRRHFDYVLTIPAYDEPAEFLGSLFSQRPRDDVLCIVTVNAPDNATAAALSRSRALASALRKRDNVIVIERLDEPVPRRQGVGLARKLAADLACTLILDGTVRCPMIFMTDADAVLPPEYFETGASRAAPGTLLYPFRHVAEPPMAERDRAVVSLQKAADLYELHLRHYVQGLVDAGSPYAHQSLGSTIVIHAETYAAVRGMPRRNAAEDFYLLNKAAKVADVTSLATPRLVIAARLSTRVPFGTGPALRNMPTDSERYISYPLEAFADLHLLLDRLRRWSLSAEKAALPTELEGILSDLGWQAGRFEHQHGPGATRWRSVLEWFDALRTMRFIRMRQRQLPAAPLLETLRHRQQLKDAEPAVLLEALRAGEITRCSGIDAALRVTA